jgi:hypothetical protein
VTDVNIHENDRTVSDRDDHHALHVSIFSSYLTLFFHGLVTLFLSEMVSVPSRCGLDTVSYGLCSDRLLPVPCTWLLADRLQPTLISVFLVATLRLFLRHGSLITFVPLCSPRCYTSDTVHTRETCYFGR